MKINHSTLDDNYEEPSAEKDNNAPIEGQLSFDDESYDELNSFIYGDNSPWQEVDFNQETNSAMKEINLLKHYDTIDCGGDMTNQELDSWNKNVNHPAHYNQGKYECIDVMREVFGDEAVKIWIKLNIFKYSWRADAKNHDEDVEKIAWYSNYYQRMCNHEV